MKTWLESVVLKTNLALLANKGKAINDLSSKMEECKGTKSEV